jgi:hypothetical protein
MHWNVEKLYHSANRPSAECRGSVHTECMVKCWPQAQQTACLGLRVRACRPRLGTGSPHDRQRAAVRQEAAALLYSMFQPLRTRASGVAACRHNVALTSTRISAAVLRPTGSRISVEGTSRCWRRWSNGHGTVRVAAVFPGLSRPASTDSGSEREQPRLTRAERRRLKRQQKDRPGDSAASSSDVGLGVSQSSTREAAIRLWAKEPTLFESNRTGLVRILSTLSVVQVCMCCRCHITLRQAYRPLRSIFECHCAALCQTHSRVNTAAAVVCVDVVCSNIIRTHGSA